MRNKKQDKYTLDKLCGCTILITGATGFIGQNLVKHFMGLCLEEDLDFRCSIIALCRSEKKAGALFQDYLKMENFELLFQDIILPIKITGTVDYILHTASCSNASYIKQNPVEVMQANIIGTDNLLGLAKEKRVKAFLFFSSGAVYGETEKLDHCVREEEYGPIAYQDEQSSYAVSKVAGENLCFSYNREYRVPAKIVRLSHTYGPGIDLEDGHIYSDFTKALLKKRDLVINSSGLSKRAFCYISDTIEGILTILLKGEAGEAYNLANVKEHYSIRELAKILTNEAYPEYGLSVKYKENTDVITDNDYPTDIAKLMALGWKPEIGVIEGFQKTVESFKEEKHER